MYRHKQSNHSWVRETKVSFKKQTANSILRKSGKYVQDERKKKPEFTVTKEVWSKGSTDSGCETLPTRLVRSAVGCILNRSGSCSMLLMGDLKFFKFSLFFEYVIHAHSSNVSSYKMEQTE